MIRRVEHGPDPGMLILYVHGDVDLDTRASLEAAIDHAFDDGARFIVINLLATTYIDSEGLATLIATHRRAAQSDVRVALVVGDERLISLFRITRLDAMFHIVDSDEAALRALRGGDTMVEPAASMTSTTVGDAGVPAGAAQMAIYDGSTEGLVGATPTLEVSDSHGAQETHDVAAVAQQLTGAQEALGTSVGQAFTGGRESPGTDEVTVGQQLTGGPDPALTHEVTVGQHLVSVQEPAAAEMVGSQERGEPTSDREQVTDMDGSRP